MKTTIRYLLTIGATLLLCMQADARIKMVALPDRGATIIRLDNPNATLIEEERVLTLQKGVNKVDFSWNGVQVDVDSIRLAVLGHPDKVVLLNVSYPPNEAALVWEISCAQAYEEPVRISYLLRNIDRLVTYAAVADKAETTVNLKSHVIMRNFSGEDFARARIVLDYGQAFEDSIQHEETKQLLFFQKDKVPITKVWKFDSAVQPWDPEKLDTNVGIPVIYRIENTEKNGLGMNALWGGKVRLQQEDGHGGTIVLGEDNIPLVPVGEKMEPYIGDSRDIVVTQRKMKDERIVTRRDASGNPVLSDTDEILRIKIENFKDSPATLNLVEHIDGQWDIEKCPLDYKRKDAGTLEFEIALPAQGKKEFEIHYHRRNLR